jgi:hypothetical protein
VLIVGEPDGPCHVDGPVDIDGHALRRSVSSPRLLPQERSVYGVELQEHSYVRVDESGPRDIDGFAIGRDGHVAGETVEEEVGTVPCLLPRDRSVRREFDDEDLHGGADEGVNSRQVRAAVGAEGDALQALVPGGSPASLRDERRRLSGRQRNGTRQYGKGCHEGGEKYESGHGDLHNGVRCTKGNMCATHHSGKSPPKSRVSAYHSRPCFSNDESAIGET